jgi:UDP-2,3-diacylglucosamine pyrophosphatase LpxH
MDAYVGKEQWPKRYRAIFFSDVHLGTRGCQAAMLLNFLKYNIAPVMKIVGDFIDGWAMRDGTRAWARDHNTVLQKVLRSARKDRKVRDGLEPVEVEYIAGNHDEFWRMFDLPMQLGDVIVRNQSVYIAKDGRRFLVIHGDLFDGVMLYAKWLAHLGDYGYRAAIVMNRWYNVLRRWQGKPYFSLSQWLKFKIKTAVNEITRFEGALAAYAKEQGFDGVICGHIHHAEVRMMENGILYINCGDWVENCTAIVETEDGQFEIIRWTILEPEETSTLEEEEEGTPALAPAFAGGALPAQT